MPDWLWQNLVGLVIGLIPSALLGLYFHRMSRRPRDLTWCVWTSPVALTHTSQEEALQLLYNGESVPSVSVSWIMLWNSGETAISEGDLSRHNPLRIVAARGSRILSADEIGHSVPGNHPSISVSEDDKSAWLSFDYLNHREGCMFSVVHTGPSPSYLAVTGEVINGAPPRQVDAFKVDHKSMPSFAYRGSPSRQVSGKHGAVLATVFLTGLSVVLVVGFFASWSKAWEVAFTGISFLLLLAMVAVIFAGAISRRTIPTPIGIEDPADRRLAPGYWDRDRPIWL